MKIIVKRPCGCFLHKNRMEPELEFETKEKAREVAKEMNEKMKSKAFCQTHIYKMEEFENEIIFTPELNFDI